MRPSDLSQQGGLRYSRYHDHEGRSHLTQVYARNEQHFLETLKLRGLGETPNPWGSLHDLAPKMPSELFAQRKYVDLMHALVWASSIAIEAKVVSAWEMLGDTGLVHETAHTLANEKYWTTDPYAREPAETRMRFLKRLLAFERKVPGLHPICSEPEDQADRLWADVESRLSKMIAPLPSQRSFWDVADYGAIESRIIGKLTQGNHADKVSVIDESVTLKPAIPGKKDFIKNREAQSARDTAAKLARIAKIKAKQNTGGLKADKFFIDIEVDPFFLKRTRDSVFEFDGLKGKSLTGRSDKSTSFDDVVTTTFRTVGTEIVTGKFDSYFIDKNVLAQMAQEAARIEAGLITKLFAGDVVA